MQLDIFALHDRLGIDFDGTLIGHPESAQLQQYILDHQDDKKFHIVTFRTTNMRKRMEADLEMSTRFTGVPLTLQHFESIASIPDVLYERKGMFDDGTEYYGWKARTCDKLGCTILLDDMIRDVGRHCEDLNIVCLDPSLGYMPAETSDLDDLVAYMIENGRLEYGEIKGPLLDELYLRGRVVWHRGITHIDGFTSWPPFSDYCWVEIPTPLRRAARQTIEIAKALMDTPEAEQLRESMSRD
jgi:hypothetical protein